MWLGSNFNGLAAVILASATVISVNAQTLESSKQWWDLARMELSAALNVRDNWNVAKNVILFLGDGMGIAASTAGRIYKGQKRGMHGEEGYLEWERFPNSALIKTYNVDRQVPDSAATATAFLCGVKVNYETIGIDPAVKFGDCEASKDPKTHLNSVLQWAQDANKDTGIVSSTRITHATPAATYAHVANRRWECNRDVGQSGHGCPDIADQLINHAPGKNIKVILGGGRQPFGATLGIPDRFTCNRTDGRDLTREWLNNKQAAGLNAKYITSASELRRTNSDNLDYLMGLFADTHIPYVSDQPPASSNSPSLAEMATKAVSMLSKSEEGFFLLVEGGRIDHAYHNNQPQKALEETVAFDEAVAAVLKEVDLDETLVIVTADHSHVLTINGYPKRGNDILGLADVSDVDGLPYTTLMFTNGPGFNMTTDGQNVTRADPTDNPLSNPNAQSQTAVPMKPFKETHGGEDVALYAAGPMSHLFHRLHEQNYIAHVMAYSACIGPSAGESCRRPGFASSAENEDLFNLPHSPLRTGGEALKSSNAVDSMAEAVEVASSAGVFMGSRGSSSGRPLSTTGGSSSSGSVKTSSRRPGSPSQQAIVFPTSSKKSSGPKPKGKFSTLSPTLQQLLESSQQRLINALGLENIKESETLEAITDIRSLLGRRALEIPAHTL